jgi:RNA polymerase primary sigma factor
MPGRGDAGSLLVGETARSLDSLDQYFADMSRYQLLSSQESAELSRQVLAGEEVRKRLEETGRRPTQRQARLLEEGEAAQQKLVMHNWKFVVTIATEYRGSGFPLRDLIMVGNIGLMRAVRKWDATRGVSLTSYANRWIKTTISKFVVREGGPTKVPEHHTATFQKVRKARARLSQELGREPDVQEIARVANATVPEVEEMLRLAQRPVELDGTAGDSPDAGVIGTYFGETASEAAAREERMVQQIDANRKIERALELLTDRQAEVLTMLFGLRGTDPLTPDEVASHFGVSKERIRQIREQAFQVIRDNGVLPD